LNRKDITMKPQTSALTRRATLGVLLAAMLATAGCAAVKPETPEEIVAHRVQERWDALIKRDFATAYTYTQPGYRATISADDYAKRFGSASKWLAVDTGAATGLNNSGGGAAGRAAS
jgi:hypothetical protein